MVGVVGSSPIAPTKFLPVKMTSLQERGRNIGKTEQNSTASIRKDVSQTLLCFLLILRVNLGADQRSNP
jgi:hypothetical protein